MTPPLGQTQSVSGHLTRGDRGESPRGTVATARPTLFRVLLTERHLQTPKAFRAQFARAAQELAERESDPEFRRLDVSGRQFQRWLDGLTPRPYSCRVLEHMLGHPVSELMRQADPPRPQSAAEPGGTVAGTAGSLPEKRVLDDEVLAHIYLATARLKLGEIEGAMEAIAPVMDLPREPKTSWMRKRVANLRQILTEQRFKHSESAAAAQQELHKFEVS